MIYQLLVTFYGASLKVNAKGNTILKKKSNHISQPLLLGLEHRHFIEVVSQQGYCVSHEK